GGLSGRRYPWGDELRPEGRWMANIYEGRFPVREGDEGADGFKGLAPVAQYPPNAYGLYDVAGNAWEWVSDWYRPDYYATLARAISLPRAATTSAAVRTADSARPKAPAVTGCSIVPATASAASRIACSMIVLTLAPARAESAATRTAPRSRMSPSTLGQSVI